MKNGMKQRNKFKNIKNSKQIKEVKKEET